MRNYLIVLLVSLTSSGCMKVQGDFCDIAEPDIYASQEVVEYLILNDRDHLEADVAENEYGIEHCGWSL